MLAVIFGCAKTSTNELAGGTVIPNLVNGNVLYEGGKPAANVIVTIKSIVVGQIMDSVVEYMTTSTDEKGIYHFEEVQNGKYVVESRDVSKNLSAVIAKFTKWIDSAQDCPTMTLQPSVTLCGRILVTNIDTLTASPFSVFIPGVSGRALVDEKGVYKLSNLPKGDYDLCFSSGNTAYFLLVSISGVIKNPRDTVFIQDVTIDFSEAAIAETYHFHDQTFEYSCPVLPTIYKAGYEPPWHKNKDFSRTGYFMISNGFFKKYTPSHTILFVTGANHSWYSDYKLKTNLQKNMGFSVFATNNLKLKITDTAGKDVVYLSSSLPSDTSNRFFRNSRIPVVNSEAYYFQDLGMTDTLAGKDFGFSAFNGHLTIASPDHPVASGLKDSVEVLFCDGFYAWGKPSASAKIIACKKSPETALIFCYETGVAMVGLKAPARRVGFFFDRTDYSTRNLTENGWKLFESSIFWAIGR
jgi:hypothetical protein